MSASRPFSGPPAALEAIALPLLTTLLLFVLYWWTLAPSISELHDNVDSAELVVIASVGKVAHPPGAAI